jgi:hypothetical protein
MNNPIRTDALFCKATKGLLRSKLERGMLFPGEVRHLRRNEIGPKAARKLTLLAISAAIGTGSSCAFPTLHVHRWLFALCAGAFSMLMWLLYSSISPSGLRSVPPDAPAHYRVVYAALASIQGILIFAVISVMV